ncbi:MAG: phosphoglycerate mutase family protein [Chloroflexota bacterium]|nr:phosphoglycerate mutase family protein [Chloroflexota bacterium]
MRVVYLVKHASPAVQPNVAAHQWELHAGGIEEAKQLGLVARDWGLASVYSSTEAKARATALLVADATSLQARVVEGFEEIRIDWIANSDNYSEYIREVLEHPGASFRATERAIDAATRFAGAMSIVEKGALPAALVTHGRVLTAYLTQLVGLEDPFAFWRAIPMPGWAALDLDGPKLISGFHALPR